MKLGKRSKPEPYQPYSPMRALHPDLHVVDGEWYETDFARRMTVVRFGTGELAIHSAIRLKEEDYLALEKLGKVKWILIPNVFHGSEAHYYTERYLDATTDPYPESVKKELDFEKLRGLRFHETVYFHRMSKTLIVTDLVFNMPTPKGKLKAFFYKMGGIGYGLAASRGFRVLGTRSKKELRKSIEKILEWDFERIIMSHGEICVSGGREIFRKAFEWAR
jgi:hypothetical protein